MKYLLDTNICIHYFRNKFGILEKLEGIGLQNCAISEMTYAQLIFGAEKSSDPPKNLKIVDTFINQITILPIFSCIPFYGKEKARLQKLGRIKSDFDLLIGATAVENHLILATENIKDFIDIQNIKIENWVIRN